MKDSTIVTLDNIFSKEQCNALEERFCNLFTNYKNLDEVVQHNTNVIKNEDGHALGIHSPFIKLNFGTSFASTIENLTKFLEHKLSRKLYYHHAFLRTYFNGSSLPIHVDAHDLDFTFTINVGGIEDWEIFVSKNVSDRKTSGELSHEQKIDKFGNDFYKFKIKRGSGVGFNSGEYHHWRNALQCEENEYVMQIFLHWAYNPPLNSKDEKT